MFYVNVNHVNVNGETLRKMREKKGFSQKELAEITGLSSRTICRYETGDTQPDQGKMRLLLDVLKENGQPEKVKKLCPYRTRVTEQGGVMFTHCVGALCMGYIDGQCSITVGNAHKDWEGKGSTTGVGSAP